MTLKARVTITIKKDILDPAGEAVKKSLSRHHGVPVIDVRLGKTVELVLDSSQEITGQIAWVNDVARKVLSNPIMEDVVIEILQDGQDER